MSTEKEIRAAFDACDKDHSGFLKGEELKTAFSTAKHEATQEELEAIMAYADENGDGQLSYEEFAKFVR
ncbi:calmodulin [Thioploca ingrica]|uniref:Calmodulin n=1 Tax=Thioploca ingrica TaxID=40754 RepID=A0A090AKF1_9GAMM|nr:calmodulin [Thioploca ingrica]